MFCLSIYPSKNCRTRRRRQSPNPRTDLVTLQTPLSLSVCHVNEIAGNRAGNRQKWQNLDRFRRPGRLCTYTGSFGAFLFRCPTFRSSLQHFFCARHPSPPLCFFFTEQRRKARHANEPSEDGRRWRGAAKGEGGGDETQKELTTLTGGAKGRNFLGRGNKRAAD